MKQSYAPIIINTNTTLLYITKTLILKIKASQYILKLKEKHKLIILLLFFNITY